MSSSQTQDEHPRSARWLSWLKSWPYTLGVSVSLVIGAISVIASVSVDVALRDPDGFLGPAWVRLPLLGLLLFAVGLVPAAVRRSGWKNIGPGVVDVLRYEWSLRRLLYIATGLATFYVCYVGYRNLKNVLPVHRDGVLFDQELLELDKWMFGGVDPAIVLHDMFGVDFTAQVLSFVYMAYLPLIPITLGIFLVLNRNLAVGAWYATTLSLNWVIGTASYYLYPALGPIYARPDLYASLPDTTVAGLQDALLNNRLQFLSNPESSEVIHGVAAFASLHTSITFAAAYFMQRTGQHLGVRIFAWTFFGLTVLATLYFGWHYIVDDIVGVIIGYLAVAIAAAATGHGFFGEKSIVAKALNRRRLTEGQGQVRDAVDHQIHHHAAAQDAGKRSVQHQHQHQHPDHHLAQQPSAAQDRRPRQNAPLQDPRHEPS
nr:phosphatase PAP2 family protein [Nesterenkonia sandarakina]